jgi:hypothetical protein
MEGEEIPMGQKDSATNDYLKQNHVFADAFNFFIYGGRPVIDPALLQELDTKGIVTPRDCVKRSDKPIERYRDSIKSLRAKFDDNGAYVILAVESQSHIHYAMPARTFMYDAIQYAKQVKEIAAKHKLEGKQKGVSNDEHLLPLVQDYKLNLIAPAFLRDEDFDLFHSDLKEVLLFIKYAKDKKKVQELVEKDEVFRHMDREAVRVINNCTGVRLPIREEEEVVDMCQGIKDLMEDAAAEAKAEAARAKAEASKATEEKITVLLKSIKAVMEKTGMTLEQTFSVLDISRNDQEKLMLML